MMQRHRIGAAFSAASEYDRHARVQHRVARELAARIAALPLPNRPRILEIGCGTGFLTEAVIAQGIEADWLITDISPEMVQRCRQRVGETENRRFAVLDGEFGEPEGSSEQGGGGYDLICSSLALQWFENQDSALSRILGWLAPGGHCLFTTLASGSFAEWRAAHAAEGLPPGTPDFLTHAEIAAMQPHRRREPPRIDRHVERHESALAFLRALKAIGAHTASQRHRPLTPSQLRKVMRHFEEADASVTYEVATCHYARPASDTP